MQQVQQQSTNVARAQEAAQAPFRDEIARQAEEVVLQTNQLEHERIREDSKRSRQERQNRRRRRDAGESSPAPTVAADEDPSPPASAEGSSRIDITV